MRTLFICRSLIENGPAETTKKSLQFLVNLVEKGKIKPVIDKKYPLGETAKAHAYVDTGRKKGNVVLKIV